MIANTGVYTVNELNDGRCEIIRESRTVATVEKNPNTDRYWRVIALSRTGKNLARHFHLSMIKDRVEAINSALRLAELVRIASRHEDATEACIDALKAHVRLSFTIDQMDKLVAESK